MSDALGELGRFLGDLLLLGEKVADLVLGEGIDELLALGGEFGGFLSQLGLLLGERVELPGGGLGALLGVWLGACRLAAFLACGLRSGWLLSLLGARLLTGLLLPWLGCLLPCGLGTFLRTWLSGLLSGLLLAWLCAGGLLGLLGAWLLAGLLGCCLCAGLLGCLLGGLAQSCLGGGLLCEGFLEVAGLDVLGGLGHGGSLRLCCGGGSGLLREGLLLLCEVGELVLDGLELIELWGRLLELGLLLG